MGERATEIGYPVLIKAVAGGGGKGMRKVEDAVDFADALASCQREATASFGNAHVLIEKYIQRPRHIEVQVFGDTHGNIVHLFERDCSLQRRHQKVIEEAPAPGMDEATREQLCAVAVLAAKAVNYVGAGTIEFIADASESLRADRIWFMEMNTRLQVEHPVTEEITGVDLVEWQLRVASGEALPLRQDQLRINGWAMEARLYAEDPAKGFLPSVGRLEHFYIPGRRPVLDTGLGLPLDVGAKSLAPHQVRGDVRVDTGVEEGGEISPYYDPMIAKIIVHADNREVAADALADACLQIECWPVHTNADFLVYLLCHRDFVEGMIDTGFIAKCLDDAIQLEENSRQISNQDLWYIGNLIYEDRRGSPNDVWHRQSGTRLNANAAGTKLWLTDGTEKFQVALGQPPAEKWTNIVKRHDGYLISRFNRTWHIREYRFDGSAHGPASSGNILSPMPGRIIAVEVTKGQAVTKGQKLLTLEAMKMEHSLTAPFDGVVTELNAEAGAQVQVEALLVRIEAVE